jgi:hypothetical protein
MLPTIRLAPTPFLQHGAVEQRLQVRYPLQLNIQLFPVRSRQFLNALQPHLECITSTPARCLFSRHVFVSAAHLANEMPVSVNFAVKKWTPGPLVSVTRSRTPSM